MTMAQNLMAQEPPFPIASVNLLPAGKAALIRPPLGSQAQLRGYSKHPAMALLFQPIFDVATAAEERCRDFRFCWRNLLTF